MSVSKSPFRAGGGSVSASASGASLPSKVLTLEELQDVLSASFLGGSRDRLLSVRGFLKATSSAEAMPAKNFNRIVGFAVKQIEQGALPEETRLKVLADDSILLYFTFALDVLQAAIAQHTKDGTFMSDLGKMQIKAEYVSELANAYKQRREIMSQTVEASRVALPSIAGVRWRVDVAISTTSLSRVFKPTVLLQLSLNDGRVRDFECSLDKFHELRYAIAKSLKHAQDLQQHPTLTREIE